MKIVLSALNAKYVHSNLAVYDLEGYARGQEKNLPLVVREFTINHNLDFILQQLYQEKAQVYAFSCYIWNVYEILTIVRELKKVLPDSEIWLGGPEASNDAEKYLRENAFLTGVILGEGEVTFYELTKVWRNSVGEERDYESVSGIMYRDSCGEIKKTGQRPLMSLDDLPFIYYDLSKFGNKILYYETSRGCPYSCSYCLSSIDKKVRFRSFSLVKGELDFFLEHKVPQVKFVDRTFNCNREHALQIWRYLAEHDNGVTNFHFEVAADIIGEEEFEVFQKMRPGLIQLEIGLQSTNPDTIREIRRVMDVEKVKKTLLTIRSFGNIHQHLDLIAGLPYEDFQSFQKSFNDAYEMRPNQLQLGFLKVLQGSYMGEQVDNYELRYRDVQPYEVLETKWISYDEILVLKKVEEMVEVYYNSDQFEHVLPFVISHFESPYLFYETIGKYYEENDLFGIGFKREARYKVLRDFCMEYFGGQTSPDGIPCDSEPKSEFSMKIFDFLLTFDYYLREKAKKRPDWAAQERLDKLPGYVHIERVEKEALRWIEDVNEQAEYCLFDYENRNPLTRDAKVEFLTELIGVS